MVILTGESGIGKTAVARAFVRQSRSEHRDVAVLSAYCVEGLSALRPYGPFRDMLSHSDTREGDGALQVAAGREAPAWLSGAAAAPGRSAFFDQFVSLCRAVSRQRPLLLFIDDLHWGDRSSLDLLARLGTALSSLPMLILVTYEHAAPEDSISIKGVQHRLGPNALELMIRGLEPDVVTQLGESLAGGALSKELAAWLVRAARGSPLRAEHLLRALFESGAIRKRLFRFSVKEEKLPEPSLGEGEILTRRLDGLEPNLRWTLEAAALSSSIVDSAVVATQMGKATGEVLRQLRIAETQGLVESVGERRWPGGGRTSRYRFRHPMIRRLFRGRVAGKRRAHLLSRAAESLERLAEDGAGELADEIAGLYQMADTRDELRKWSSRAADLAERLYAIYEVEDFLRVAARHTDDELERLRLESRLARIYGATGREPEAKVLLETAYSRARELGEVATESNAGIMLGWLQLERGIPPLELVEFVNELVDKARRMEQPDPLVLALDLACVVAERLGRAEEALLMAEESVHVAEGSGNPETVAQASYRLARVHVSWGSPGEGRDLAQRALDLFEQLGEPGGVSVCHDLLGLASFRAGEWEAALSHWENALESTELAGIPDEKVVMQVNIAELLTLRGDFERAERMFTSALRLAEELDDQRLARRCETAIARLEFERGDYGAVLQLTEEIRKRLPESGAWKENFQTTAIRALSYLELGDELQAWHEAVSLERLYQGKDGWFERRAEGDAVRIRVIDLDSDAWLAGMVAQQGIGETADKDPYGEGFLQYHQAQVLARAQPQEAVAAAERAVELFEQLGAVPMLTRARRLREDLVASGVEGGSSGSGGIDDNRIDEWFENLEG